MMETLSHIGEVRRRVREWRAQGLRVGLAPTMGNLHRGHLSLVEALRPHADRIVVSLFVNPTQFGVNEDFGSYPRTLDADLEQLRPLGVAAAFVPEVSEMYPDGAVLRTRIELPDLTGMLCGATRPGHFAGVATVVAKLLNIVQPDVAAFGKKDYQQLRLIERMVRDLDMPVRILAVETLREPDGLAMSSRNGYLDAAERGLAQRLQAVLRETVARLRSGEQAPAAERWARQQLEAGGFEPDYVELRRQVDLAPPQSGDADLVVLAAARLGRTRLIDNLEFALNDSN